MDSATATYAVRERALEEPEETSRTHPLHQLSELQCCSMPMHPRQTTLLVPLHDRDAQSDLFPLAKLPQPVF